MPSKQVYGRNNMVMIDQHNKIYGSLGIAEPFVYNTVKSNSLLTMSNCREGPFNTEVTELSVYGKSEQATTTGAQLWEFGDIEVQKLISKKLSVSLKTGKYTITADVDGTDTAPSLVLVGKKNINIPKGKETGTSFELTEEATTILLYASDNYEHSDGNTTTFKNVMLNIGDTSYPWEPYTGGQPSPSPDYPQEIKSIGNNGKINVTVRGKNLFDLEYAMNPINWEGPDPYYYIPYYVGKGNTVSISYSKRLDIGEQSYICIGRNKGSISDAYTWLYHSNVQNLIINNKSFVAEDDYIYLCGAGKHITTLSKISDLQIEISPAPTSYEPYHEPQSMDIATPNGLPGIPVTYGGNYTDDTGQQWICDEIDFARGVYVQRIKLVDIIEQTTKIQWTRQTGLWGNNDNNATLAYYVYINGSNDGTDWDISSKNLGATRCSHFRYGLLYKASITAFQIGTYIAFRFPRKMLPDWNPDNPTGEAFYNWLVEQKNAGTPVLVQYALANPIETPLTTEQLASYKQLRTYKGTTIVDNDVGAGMKVTYKALGNK